MSTASSSEDSISSVVYVTILKGLERLLLTDVLTPQDAEVIVKLSVDRYARRNEAHREKTGILPMRKQRRRSASQ